MLSCPRCSGLATPTRPSTQSSMLRATATSVKLFVVFSSALAAHDEPIHSRSTQPCILLGSINRVPALIVWGIGRNVTSAEWQITLSYGMCVLVVVKHVCELLYSL